MLKLNNLTEEELLGTFCLLDDNTIVLLGTLFANDVLFATAPRLHLWLVDQFVNEQFRRLTGREGSPEPLELEIWTDAEISQALACCLLIRRACVKPMDEEFTDLLTDVVSVHAIKRLITEVGVQEWN